MRQSRTSSVRQDDDRVPGRQHIEIDKQLVVETFSRRIAALPSVDLQKLDAILHLLRREDLGNQHRASNEQPDGRIGGHEQDAGVRHSSAVKAQMIGVDGDQYPAVCFCKREQRGV